MLTFALVLLGVAIAGALVPFNVPGLIVAIAAVLGAAALISAMRDELRAYDECMGPGTSCSVGPNIDLLGQAASIISAGAFIAALALEIPAVAAMATGVLAALGLSLEAAATVLKYSGIVACGATILILLGLLTNVKAYEACREAERDPTRDSGSGLTSFDAAARMDQIGGLVEHRRSCL